jgi:hypothetical protein
MPPKYAIPDHGNVHSQNENKRLNLNSRRCRVGQRGRRRVMAGYAIGWNIALLLLVWNKVKTFVEPEVTNRTAHIEHLCRKTVVLSCHRCLINPGVEKLNYI